MRTDPRIGGAIAIVDGTVRQVGASVADGWKISAIDPESRTITITHDQADPVTMAMGDISAD